VKDQQIAEGVKEHVVVVVFVSPLLVEINEAQRRVPSGFVRIHLILTICGSA
jgi:hypothetical protein